MLNPSLSAIRLNTRARVIHCARCHFLHVVPPDCPVEPVCPRCLWQANPEVPETKEWTLHWLWAVVTGLLGVAVGLMFGKH